MISPQDILSRYPYLNLEGVVGGVFLPRDGQCNPVDVTQAYAKGARMGSEGAGKHQGAAHPPGGRGARSVW